MMRPSARPATWRCTTPQPSAAHHRARPARVGPAAEQQDAAATSWLLAGLVTVSDDELAELDGVGSPSRFLPGGEDNATASGTTCSSGSMGSMDAFLLNACQAVVPGCGSHTVVPAQPWKQVTIQGCYVVHGPAVLRKVAPGMLQATLRRGAWIECLNTGTDAVSSILKEAEHLHSQHQPSGLQLSDNSIRITTDTIDTSDCNDGNSSDNSRWQDHNNLSHRSASPIAAEATSSSNSNSSGNGDGSSNSWSGSRRSPPHDPAANSACDAVYVLVGAHMELHGGYTLHNSNGRGSNCNGSSSNGNGSGISGRSGNGSSSGSDNGMSGLLDHLRRSVSSLVVLPGSLQPISFTAMGQRPSTPQPQAAAGGGGGGASLLPGLLPHDGFTLVSVHSLPEDEGLEIELHGDSLVSHPLNVVCPKKFTPTKA